MSTIPAREALSTRERLSLIVHRQLDPRLSPFGVRPADRFSPILRLTPA